MKKYIIILCCIVGFGSCDKDTFTLDLLDNPNNLTPSSANIDLVLNGVVQSAIGAESSLSSIAHTGVRYRAQFGTYAGQFSSFNESSAIGIWSPAYSCITNANLVIQLADEQSLPHHKGVAQTMKAISLLTLVDAFGDVVADEAANVEFDAPSLQDDEEVYALAMNLLDEATTNLSASQSSSISDPIYGNAASWRKLANSVKIQALVNTRLVANNTAALNAIISGGDYITSNADDYELKYSSATAPVDSRSGLFTSNYLAGASGYIANYLIDKLKNRFATEDPRILYYIYRQTLSDPMGTDDTCSGSGYDYCYLGDGYWGRDHGDNTGIPADGLARSIVGVYPAGGAYDNGAGVPGPSSSNAAGAGVEPLLLASQVDFLLAEAALTMGTDGDPLEYLRSGIQKSMEKVFSFAPGNHGQADIDAYVARVEAVYNASADDEARLNVIITELYLASYMSSKVMYNAYRRTGMPLDIQSPVIAVDAFPRSLFLPTQETEANKNIEQKPNMQVQVFWDNNPADNFID